MSAASTGMMRLTRSGQSLAIVLSVVVALLIASSWLVFPYFVRDLNLVENVGADVKTEKLNRLELSLAVRRRVETRASRPARMTDG